MDDNAASALSLPSSGGDPIDINVGGKMYTTDLDTLTKFPNSKLAKMFNNENQSIHFNPISKMYFINRDGKMFRHVLNFLRNNKLLLPENFTEKDLLMEEASFYEIEGLIEALNNSEELAEEANSGNALFDVECTCGEQYLENVFEVELEDTTNVKSDVICVESLTSGDVTRVYSTNFNFRINLSEGTTKIHSNRYLEGPGCLFSYLIDFCCREKCEVCSEMSEFRYYLLQKDFGCENCRPSLPDGMSYDYVKEIKFSFSCLAQLLFDRGYKVATSWTYFFEDKQDKIHSYVNSHCFVKK